MVGFKLALVGLSLALVGFMLALVGFMLALVGFMLALVGLVLALRQPPFTLAVLASATARLCSISHGRCLLRTVHSLRMHLLALPVTA